MRRELLVALCMLFGTAEQGAVRVLEQEIARSFEEDDVGKPPGGFRLAVGREGPPGRWLVQRDGDSHVLAHAGDPATPGGFAVAVSDGAFGDVEVSVRLRMRGGSRAAGMVWRYDDPMNHFAVQLNLAMQELAIYRVVAGNRIRIDREDGLELDPDAWHTLRIVADGESLRVFLSGIPVFRERSRAFRGSGAVGLWTASDAVVWFDDFRAEVRAERGR